MRDAPDVHCKDAQGRNLYLELRVLGDADGTAAYMLGRGRDPLEPDPLKKEAKPPSFSLELDALRQLEQAINAKIGKRYGRDVALMLGYVGGLWNARDFSSLAIEETLSSKARAVFDAGTWVLSTDDKIVRIA